MKIAALHTDFRIYWPARLQALSKVLKERGDELTVIEIAGKGSPYAFANQKEIQDYWIVLFPEDSPERLSPSQIKKELFRVLGELEPDIILAGATAFPSGALAVQWGLSKGIRVVTFDDAKHEVVQRNRIVEFIKKAVYKGVDAMIYPAPDWQATGLYWGFQEPQMFYGLDVVDNAYWSKPVEKSFPIENYFVAVGRQIEKKNYFSIAKAYTKYRHEIGEAAYDLVLIGDGPEHERIKRFVVESDLRNHIHLLPFLSQEKLPEMYQYAKGLICCSNSSETWGLVINEAMACGCPVIASIQCGATNTLVKEGVNGFCFSCEDINRLVLLMTKLHRQDDEKQLAMREASKRIIANWGLSRFTKACVDAIDYVVKHSKRKTNWLDKIIIRIWKGRYRPV